MATRCYIALEDAKTKKVTAIYSHFDGYLKGVGETLEKYYNNYSIVKELISLGGISSLGRELTPNPEFVHNFDNKQEDVTVAYHRDRKEKLSILNFDSFDAFVEEHQKGNLESYAYIYRHLKGWTFLVGDKTFGSFKKALKA